MGKDLPLRKRIMEGVVVSDKMQKTITVRVEHHVTHPVYKKTILRNKKFKVHDEQEQAKIGDKVKIVECRPYSKEKHFRLLEVIQ